MHIIRQLNLQSPHLEASLTLICEPDDGKRKEKRKKEEEEGAAKEVDEPGRQF